MTGKNFKELRNRLRGHYEDYIAGRTQDFRVVFEDCVQAADAFDEMTQHISYYADKAAEVTAASRADILQRASDCVCGQRQQDYGKPEDNFATIARLWSAYRGIEFDAVDVALMMALLKIGRICGGSGSEDSFVDLAGYAACGGEIWSKYHAQLENTTRMFERLACSEGNCEPDI